MNTYRQTPLPSSLPSCLHFIPHHLITSSPHHLITSSPRHFQLLFPFPLSSNWTGRLGIFGFLGGSLLRLLSLTRSRSLTLSALARAYPSLADKPQRPLPFALGRPFRALARCHAGALAWLLTLKALQYTSQIVEPLLIAELAVALSTYEGSATRAAARKRWRR